MARRHAALLVLMSTCMAVTSAAKATQDRISLRLRHSYPVCGGVCPNFEIRVSANGDVETLDLPLGRKSNPSAIVSFHVGRDAVEGFRRIARRAMAEGLRAPAAKCEKAMADDGMADPLDDPWPDDIEMIFDGPDGLERMTACGSNWRVRSIVQDALLALGVDAGRGRKLEY